MPKSKKKKNNDFQKVKLKLGKRLPQGDNVTNLSFKTRQIQLTQRIRVGDSKELTTKRHLSIQDLLRQCDHHSSSGRLNAVSGLKEVWLNHHEELMVLSNNHGYGEILKKLSAMLIDNESIVRHAVINLFKLIFNKIGSQNHSRSSPMIGGDLFKHIHAYLCCAMNHIHEDVRLDSLVLFDALLETFPQFMVQHTNDLLRNLVSMISAPISLGAKGDKTTQKLTMNPESKLLAMKFRARVLQRLKCALQGAVNSSVNGGLRSNQNSGAKGNNIWSLHFDSENNSVRQSTVIVSQNCTQRFQLIFTGVSNEMAQSILSPGNLENFMHQSMPVLLQCWKEAIATTTPSFATEIGVSSDSVDVMSLVLAVINLTFSLASTNTSGGVHLISPVTLVQNYYSDFASVFMGQFPFSVQIEAQVPKKKRKKKGSASIDSPVTQQSLMILNLDICHVMSCFCADLSASLGDVWIRKVKLYVTQTIQGSPSSGLCHLLAKILNNIFLNPQVLDHCACAFRAALDFYLQRHVQSSDKIVFFDLFSFMFTTWDGWKNDFDGPKPLTVYHHNVEIESILNDFHASLPSLLQSIPRQEDNVIWIKNALDLLFRSTNRFGLNSHIEECLSSILHPKTGLIAINNEAVQSKVLSLLTQGPALNKEHLQHILYSIRRPIENPLLPHRKSKSMACYAIGCVALGIRRAIPFTNQKEFNLIKQNKHNQLSNYLKFLFSLQIGMNKEEMEELIPPQAPGETALDPDDWLNVTFKLTDSQWERHMAIANYVAVELTDLHIPASSSDGFGQPITFIGSMEQMWIQNIAAHKGIHLLSAYSLVLFIQLASLPHSIEKPSKQFCRTMSLVIASVLASLYKDAKYLNVSEKVVDDIKSQMVSCLMKMPCLVKVTWSKLVQRSKSSFGSSLEDKQSAVMAMELLRSEDILMKKIGSMESADSVVDTVSKAS